MKFSIIVATRDRTQLLDRSLRAVAAQTHPDLELIVVDDSTTEATRRANAALVGQLCPDAIHLDLPAEQRGRGPAFPRNHGIAVATGEYVAFLDDDDEWIDKSNLASVAAILQRHSFDVHFTDQEAMLANGAICPPPSVWTEDLGTKLPGAGLAAPDGSYRVAAEQMLLSDGFAHLNTIVVRRSLLQDTLGGFDLRITYEEDRELYFRLLDRADAIGYTPRLVARHHVPAGANRPSASSTVPDVEKDASRLRYFDNLIATARRDQIRTRAQRERIYTLKRIAQRAAAAGNLAEARQVGKTALRDSFGYKWAGYMGWLWLRSIIAAAKAARSPA